MLGRAGVDDPDVDEPAIRTDEVERDRSAATVGRPGPVDLHNRAAVRVLQRCELVQQPVGQAANAGVNRVEADSLEEAKPLLDRRE